MFISIFIKFINLKIILVCNCFEKRLSLVKAVKTKKRINERISYTINKFKKCQYYILNKLEKKHSELLLIRNQ